MMSFRETKLKLIELLGNEADDRFRVIGYQRQSKNADEVLNNDRLVQVYYSEGDFLKSAGRMKGPKTHDITFEIDMTTSAKASVDITVLDNPSATESQKATALADLKEAVKRADDKCDELIDHVYQILMDARNEKLGFTNNEISSRWIAKITKDQTLERGDLAVKTANMKYTCRTQEYVLGDPGYQPDTVTIDSNMPAFEDEGSGISVENEISS